MEEPKKLNEVNLLSSSFSKHVSYVRNGETVGGVANQQVNLTPSTDGLLQFNYKEQSLLSVKEKDGNYTLHINDPKLFKDKDGNLFPGLNESGVLTLDPDKSSLTMSHNTEEMRFEISAEEDKKYVITTGAYGIKIRVEDEKGVTNYNFRIPPIKENDIAEGIGINIHPQLMEEFLNPDKKLCKFKYKKTASNEAVEDNEATEELLSTLKFSPQGSLSVDLFASFIQTLEPGTTIDFTDSNKNGYYISVLPDQGDELNDGTRQPPAFITRVKNGKPFSHSNFLFVDGQFKHCDDYFLMTETDETGKIHPYIDLDTGIKNHIHYKHELPVNDDGTLSDRAGEILDFVRDGVFMKAPFNTPSSDTERNDASINYKDKFYFEKRDSRSTKDIPVYGIIRNETYNEEDVEEERSVEPPSPTSDDNINNEQQEQPDQEQEQKPDSPKKEESEEAENDEPPPPPNDTIFDISQPVEVVGSTMCAIGIFLFLGAMLTGGLTLIAGLAVFGIGFSGVLTADAYKFRPLRHAQKKVKQYEKDEKEAKKQELKQNEKENEVDKADEAATESENILNNLIKHEFDLNSTNKNIPENGFASLYEKYGILPVEEGQKVNALTSYEGLEAKRQMLSQISAIQSSAPERREQAVNNFIASNFIAMPAEERKHLTEGQGILANSPQAQTKLQTFAGALRESVSFDEKKQELIEKQEQFVSSAKENAMVRFLTSKSITPEQREKRLNRYANVVVRRFANDPDLTEKNVSKIISNLPEDERIRGSEILGRANLALTSHVSAVEELGRENREQDDKLSQVRALAHSINAVQNYTKFVWKNDVEIDAENYIKHSLYSAYNDESGAQTLDSLKTNISEIKDPTSQEQAILDSLSELYTPDAELVEIGQQYTRVNNQLFKNYGSILADAYLQPDLVSGIAEFPAAGTTLRVESNAIGTENDPLNKMIELVVDRTNLDTTGTNLTRALNDYNKRIEDYRAGASTKLAAVIDKLEANLQIEADWSEKTAPVSDVINELTDKYQESFTGLGNATPDTETIQEKIANLIATKRALNSKCPENVQKIYSQLEQTLDFVLSGKFANVQIADAIREDGKEHSEFKEGETLKDTQNKLDEDIASYQNSKHLLAPISDELRSEMARVYREELKNDRSGKINSKQAMLQAFKNAFDSMNFEGKDLLAPLFEDLTGPAPKGDSIAKIDALIGSQRVLLENIGKTQRSLYNRTLGEECANNIYNSTFTKGKYRQQAPELTKKEDNKITDKSNELKNFNSQSAIIEDFFNQAMSGNFLPLKKLLESEGNFNETLTNDEMVIVDSKLCKNYLARIGIDPKELMNILDSANWGKLGQINAKIPERFNAIRTNLQLELRSLKSLSNITTPNLRKKAQALYTSNQTLCDIESFKRAVNNIEIDADDEKWSDFTIYNEKLLQRLGIKPEELTSKDEREANLKKIFKNLDEMQLDANKRYENATIKSKDKNQSRVLNDASQKLLDIESFRSDIDKLTRGNTPEQKWPEFISHNEALLKRLGINPEDLTNKGERAANLKKIYKRLDKMKSDASKTYDRNSGEDKKKGKKPSADISSKSANSIRLSLATVLRNITSIHADNVAKKKEKEAAEAKSRQAAAAQSEAIQVTSSYNSPSYNPSYYNNNESDFEAGNNL